MRRRAKVAAAAPTRAPGAPLVERGDGSWPAFACFATLLAVRLLSAAVNTVHDCDEVFNYWEPLHFLLHGYGLQTWENSPQFALRSYLYLLLHALFAAPASLLLGADAGKRATFHVVRGVLGAACALAEAALCRATARAAGRQLGVLLWAVLLASSGLFTSSTTLLPSTFTMVAFAAGAALCLDRRPLAAAVVCVAGGLLGWPFAGLAAVPLGLHAIWVAGLLPTAAVVAGSAAAVLLPSVCADAFFYGTSTASVWNLIRYNVGGGGNSARYGTEGALFYVRNMFNAFNLALPLAGVAPVAELAVARVLGRRPRKLVLLVLLPLYLWIGVMSAIPHKEERFAYVVYPQVCVGAALLLDTFLELASTRAVVTRLPASRTLAMACVCIALTAMTALSAARTAALVGYYSAPMRLFAQLPAAAAAPTGRLQTVCIGDEWHRFPSSFYLPGPQYRLGFVKTGFAGLLPVPFDPAAGGTAFAPAALNDRNEETAAQHVADPAATCDFWVGLQSERPPNGAQWSLLAEAPFLDAGRSPALWRAFRVPLLSARRNAFTTMRLLRRDAGAAPHNAGSAATRVTA